MVTWVKSSGIGVSCIAKVSKIFATSDSVAPFHEMSIDFAKSAKIFVDISAIFIDMAQVSTFSVWLNSEISNRGWSIRETAEASGISRTTISNIISAGETPTFDTCVALADVFNKPRTEVVILAGLLPTPPEHDAGMEELLHLFDQLGDADREDLIALAETKLARIRKAAGAAKGAGREAKSGAKQKD